MSIETFVHSFLLLGRVPIPYNGRGRSGKKEGRRGRRGRWEGGEGGKRGVGRGGLELGEGLEGGLADVLKSESVERVGYWVGTSIGSMFSLTTPASKASLPLRIISLPALDVSPIFLAFIRYVPMTCWSMVE